MEKTVQPGSKLYLDIFFSGTLQFAVRRRKCCVAEKTFDLEVEDHCESVQALMCGGRCRERKPHGKNVFQHLQYKQQSSGAKPLLFRFECAPSICVSVYIHCSFNKVLSASLWTQSLIKVKLIPSLPDYFHTVGGPAVSINI